MRVGEVAPKAGQPFAPFAATVVDAVVTRPPDTDETAVVTVTGAPNDVDPTTPFRAVQADWISHATLPVVAAE
jgi:hypothetical protein